MNSVKLILSTNNEYYSYQDASSIEMCILGGFLTSDVGFHPSFFKKYAFNNEQQYTSANLTSLEKENGYILLNDQYSEEEIPTFLKMTWDQFVKLLDDWEEMVCKREPKEVIIKHENDEFVIETKN